MISWSAQVEYATGKANRVFGLLRSMFKECKHEGSESA